MGNSFVFLPHRGVFPATWLNRIDIQQKVLYDEITKKEEATLKVTIQFVPKHQEENAELYLHEDHKQIEEMKAYLESDGTVKHTIAVTHEGKMIYLSGEMIFSIEAEKNVRLIHTQEETYHSQHKLYELEELLPRNFVRISRSAILNTNKVRLYRPLPNGLMAAELENGTTAYISRKYLKNLLERIQ